MRRVVVTGLGLVTPLACGVEATWSRLLEGQSGVGDIRSFDASDLSARIAAEVPRPTDPDAHADVLNIDEWIDKKEQRRNDDFILFSLVAAEQALADANWKPSEDDQEARLRTGVLVGSGIGGLKGIEATGKLLEEKGPRKVSPFLIPGSLINLCSGQSRSNTVSRVPNTP